MVMNKKNGSVSGLNLNTNSVNKLKEHMKKENEEAFVLVMKEVSVLKSLIIVDLKLKNTNLIT